MQMQQDVGCNLHRCVHRKHVIDSDDRPRTRLDTALSKPGKHRFQENKPGWSL